MNIMNPSRAIIASGSLLAASVVFSWTAAAQGTMPARRQVMPRYDNTRALKLPDSYRKWILVGSSLGLSYAEGGEPHEMFHETLMEPTAYEHFVRTGMFREGTMLALMLHGQGEGTLPGRTGRFAAEIHGVEMAVKDSTRVPEGWAYYAFGGMGNIRTTAQPMPTTTCYSCHLEHAARDNVFLQFYPLLAEAAHIPVPAGK